MNYSSAYVFSSKLTLIGVFSIARDNPLPQKRALIASLHLLYRFIIFIAIPQILILNIEIIYHFDFEEKELGVLLV
jgi:hypothetical protein